MDIASDNSVQSTSGVDLSLLRSNLARPLADRLRHNARMVRLCQALQRGNPRLQKKLVDTPMPEFNSQGLVETLVTNQVEFVLIGGLAMIFHGSAHVTQDVDVCYQRSPENIQKLADALAPLHPSLRGAPRDLPFRLDAPTIQAGLNFTLDTDFGPLDLLGEVKGIGGFDQVAATAEEGDFLGFKVRVLSLDGLIVSKKAAGRYKDQSHVLELEELRKLL